MKNILNNNKSLMSVIFAIALSFAMISCDAMTPEQIVAGENSTSDLLTNGDRGGRNIDLTPDRSNGREDNKDEARPNDPNRLPIPCLELTREQRAQIDQLTRNFNETTQKLQMAHREKINAIMQAEREAMAELMKGSRGNTDNNVDAEQRRKLAELQKQWEQFQAESRVAMQRLREAQQNEMAQIRRQLQAGTITREEAAEAMREINAKYREMAVELNNSMKEKRDEIAKLRRELANSNNSATRVDTELAEKQRALRERTRAALEAAEAEFKANMASARERYMGAIYNLLNREQRAIWDEWLKTGKYPC